MAASGAIAEAANPVFYSRHVVGWVIVYSAPLADVMRTVSTVRHEILVAGGIALLLAIGMSGLAMRYVAPTDIVALIAAGRARVRERFGIELEPEVQLLGDVRFPW